MYGFGVGISVWMCVWDGCRDGWVYGLGVGISVVTGVWVRCRDQCMDVCMGWV